MIELAFLLILLTGLMMPGFAFGQVSVNRGALDQLQPAPQSPPTPKPAAKSTAESKAKPKPASKPASHHATQTAPQKQSPTPPPQRPVTLAPAAPSAAALAPPVVAPAKPLVPAAPVPVTDGAAGTVTPIQNGIRVTFGAGSAEINPATAAAVKAFARAIAPDPAADVNLYAYSTGPADDPSTPRRLSLSRALVMRSLLIGEGLASTRIYPRVMTPTPPQSEAAADAPPDRVDIVKATGSPSKPSGPETAQPGTAP